MQNTPDGHYPKAICSRTRARSKSVALALLAGLALSGPVQARTWSFEDGTTGLSPITALDGSVVTLDGSFDFIFDADAGQYKVSAINVVMGNTVLGTFSNFSTATVTTTGADRVFNFDGGSGFTVATLSFTVTESSQDNRLDDSNPTGDVVVTDRPGGFIAGVSISPHDVLFQTETFSFPDFSVISRSVAAFGNVGLIDPDFSGSGGSAGGGDDPLTVVPIPASLPLLASGFALVGMLSKRRAPRRKSP